MPIGKGRVRPQHIAASGGVGGFEQVRAADFFVAARGEFGDDQVAFLVEEEKAVPVFDDESVGPADGFARGGGLESFPNALARAGFEAAQLAVAADAVDVAVFEEGRTHNGVEAFSVLLSGLFGAPKGGNGRCWRRES